MDLSKKPKTTQEDLPKGIPSNWQEVVWEKNKTQHKFWEESWNEEHEDWVVGFSSGDPLRKWVYQLGRSSVG